MRNILNESQASFNFKSGPEERTKTGKFYKKLYLFGDGTFDLNKSMGGAMKTAKKYLGKYSGWTTIDGQFALWMMVWKNNETGEYDTTTPIQNNFKPYIDKINETLRYTLVIDDLMNELQNFTPSTDTDESKRKSPTKEEASKIYKKLDEFKEQILNVASGEELQQILSLMMTVKRGKAAEPFSPYNIWLIKAQKPDATNVCTARQWSEWYNRKIKPEGATTIWMKLNKKGGKDKNKEKEIAKARYGANKLSDLTGNQRKDVHFSSFEKTGEFEAGWYKAYDVSDTVQMEGTEDQIARDDAMAQQAKDDLAGRTIPGLDTDANTDVQELKPILNGLKEYAQQTNIPLNQRQGVMLPNEVTRGGTKQLASQILMRILSGKVDNKFQARAAAVAQSPTARRQQVEIAAWWFMKAFDIPVTMGDVDINTIFGQGDPSKSPEEQRQQQKNQINSVLSDIQKAVFILVEFVNKNMKRNRSLSEDEGNMKLGQAPSVTDIAKSLGLPSDIVNEYSLEQIAERLRRKLNLI
jgi:hypothetical protein